MTVAFASTADHQDQQLYFEAIAPNIYAATAEGDPNVLVIIGKSGIMVVDTTATPAMAQPVIEKIREISDAPFKYVVLSIIMPYVLWGLPLMMPRRLLPAEVPLI